MITKRVAVPVAAAVAVVGVFTAVGVASAGSRSGSGPGSHRPVAAGAHRGGTTSGIPSPYPLMTGKEPPECTLANLKVRVSDASSRADGSFLILRVGWAGPGHRGCVLATGGWPVVRLHLSNGVAPVGKADAFRPAMRARRLRSSRTALATMSGRHCCSGPAGAPMPSCSTLVSRA